MNRGGNAPSGASPLLSAPYSALAVHYDTVMAHVDYPGWSQHLRRLYQRARHPEGFPPRRGTPAVRASRLPAGGLSPTRILELAAGTCRLARHPVFPGVFSVHTDLSPHMLACATPDDTRDAAEGTGPAGAPLRRAACDVRHLPFRAGDGGPGEAPGFDLALMVYDSLNYLTDAEAVRRAFDEVFRVLVPGGLFLFDVTTETCSRRWFADTLDFQETGAGSVVRASRYDAASRTQLNLFTFFTLADDGRYIRSEEVHRQRIWPASFLKKTAREAGFDVHACLADFTLNPGTDRDERLHFVVQKPAARPDHPKKPLTKPRA